MVHDRVGRGILEPIEIPVRVRCEHDGRHPCGRCVHVDMPAVGRYAVVNVGLDLAGKSLAAVGIGDFEDDAVAGVLDDFKMTLFIVSLVR
jgi:hypothetical protein